MGIISSRILRVAGQNLKTVQNLADPKLKYCLVYVFPTRPSICRTKYLYVYPTWNIIFTWVYKTFLKTQMHWGMFQATWHFLS
jgi:hypothetical protein